MDEKKAITMYSNAVAWLGDDFAVELYDFATLSATEFLESYCWCVFGAGFRNATVGKHFDAITEAFHGFDIDAVAKMDAIDVEALPIKHEQKANCFLQGAKAIADEGFDEFKERLRTGGKDLLERELPYVGEKVKKHLAKIIGLEDTWKDDRWLVQCAEACSTDVGSLVSFLVEEFDKPKHHVDTILFEYCQLYQEIPSTEQEGDEEAPAT